MLQSRRLFEDVRGRRKTKRVLFDVAMAFVLTFVLAMLQPQAAQSAGGGSGGDGGPALPTSEGDDTEPKECECESRESTRPVPFDVTCVNSAGASVGGIPMGSIGYAGAALTNLHDQYWDLEIDLRIWGREVLKDFGLDLGPHPFDDGGSFSNDGFGHWDSLQVRCDGEEYSVWETLVGDCDENPPTCAPRVKSGTYICEMCPFGYEFPSPMPTPW